jgi:hypothetical protein
MRFFPSTAGGDGAATLGRAPGTGVREMARASLYDRLLSLVASEHICVPPEASMLAHPTAEPHVPGVTWRCPDCEQVYARARD